MTELASRLRVERLAIVESRTPLKFIRDIPLHAGLNIVWAEELAAAGGGSEVQRAGHGVGKSTFLLMLRAVLGDEGAAVKTMRNHLAEHYASGGIAAEVVVGPDRFAVFRSFGSQSYALKDGTVDQLFDESFKANCIDFSSYLATVGEQACLQHLAKRTLPSTGQAAEWAHVLCWLARDQALGLRQYFEWRSDDGTGLRRRSKDPPALTRLVLGLISDVEVKAEATIARINTELPSARESLRNEEQRNANTRAIVEMQLRMWAKVSPSLAMVADDLFAPSVTEVVAETSDRIEREISQAQAEIGALDQELIELDANLNAQRRATELAKAGWDIALARKNKDDAALKAAREQRDKLFQLVGSCRIGVAYSACNHLKEMRSTFSFSEQKEIGILKKSIEEHEDREVIERRLYEQENAALAPLLEAQKQKIARKTDLNKAIGERNRRLGEGDAVRKTLAEWREIQKTPETAKLSAARSVLADLENNLERAKGAKASAQFNISDRQRAVNARFVRLAEAFGTTGAFVPTDEKTPFQMNAEGDAYTVLEILLGDLACAADGAEGGGAHPGLLIFDCPREREMSPQIYERFLKLVDELCREVPGLQVVLTTTTPPPVPLCDEPTRILKLSHASDDDLLLKRRIENLLRRVAPAMHEEDEV